tara:strand:+ start:8912 stop:9298 length:387 start_codon:yes stop_codon:yes gene_type:complete
MAKKKAAKKATTKKAPAKKSAQTAGQKAAATRKAAADKAAKAKADAPKPKEIDPKSLTAAQGQKRCAAIYRLEKVIEGKRALEDVAKRGHKAATSGRKEAEEALAQEIQEQRFGPGPLFNAAGDGPAE